MNVALFFKMLDKGQGIRLKQMYGPVGSTILKEESFHFRIKGNIVMSYPQKQGLYIFLLRSICQKGGDEIIPFNDYD